MIILLGCLGGGGEVGEGGEQKGIVLSNHIAPQSEGGVVID